MWIVYCATTCYGNDQTAFPPNRLLAAAGEGIWEGSAACGRQYLVTCINLPPPSKCISGAIIQIKVVDRASTAVSRASSGGATLVLSADAYSKLVQPPNATFINISFRQ
ncbi:hypothetical protein RND81_10G043300 [Saponaria officinalis]|uniref:Expansin-like EG45 domain-containing protein n=1 Tax=Saponaria officinalis TaxID=3572 RepID=A0AAW1HY44_SAPOF